MQRRALDSLVAISAGIIAFTGQVFLIAPHLLGNLGHSLPVMVVMSGGVIYFAAGWLLFSTISFENINWKARIIYLFGAIATGALTYLYFRSGRYFILPLTGILALMMVIATIAGRQGKFLGNILSIAAVAANLSTGILLLAAQRVPIPGWPTTLNHHQAWMGILFTVIGLAGIASFWITSPTWKRILEKAGAIPWLAWLIVHVSSADWSWNIPAAAFVIGIVASDTVPWEKFKLPQQDILGKRLAMFIGVVETAFLISISYTLLIIEPEGMKVERDFLLAMFTLSETLLCYATASVLVTINKLSHGGNGALHSAGTPTAETMSGWEQRIARLIQPFSTYQAGQEHQIKQTQQQLASTEKLLEIEKRRNSQLVLLSELSQQLEAQLDAPVSAQLAISTLQRSINCSFAALYLNDPERRELVVLAVAGEGGSILPPGYRQPINSGVLGRALRQRKTQIVDDCRHDADFMNLPNEDTRAMVAVPLIDHGHMKGVLEIGQNETNAFGSHEVQIAEATARTLLRAWERSEYHRRLTDLIQAGVSLTTQPDPQAAVQEVANIARQTLRARFVFVTLLDQDGNFTRIAFAGTAPRLLKSINQQAVRETLIQSALNAERPFRVRDIRRYRRASRLDIDFSGLRSLIAIPIRMHGLSVGAMLAFGKQGEVFFTENDESLARLLSSQASAAIESAWLSHELRTSLATTTQLYQLSFHVIQSEELKDAAAYIAEAALRLCSAKFAGIILFSLKNEVEAEVQLDEHGNLLTPEHPMDLVRRAMETRQSIILSTGRDEENICFPLTTRMRTYGAIWLTLHHQQSARFITNLQTLVNQAGVALERAILLAESRQHAKAIEDAYQELENAYDHTLAALMSALDARDRETEGHSVRVSRIARLLGEAMSISAQQRKAIERGSLLHDIGKIGISDSILHKPGPLSETEWAIMRQHPDIGARIVEGIPFLQDTLPIIRYHQERWDGSGYPIGLTGKDIPLLARVFAVADAFDALTSDRPYRKRISNEEALTYMQANAGVLFDPEVVSALTNLNADNGLSELTQE